MPQLSFGSGEMWGRAQGSACTPVRFGTLQGVTVDFSFATREFYGQQQFAIAMRRDKGRITGSARFAHVTARLFSDIVFGAAAPTPGVLRTEVEERQIVHNGAVTVTHSANYVKDLGVVRALNGHLYERVLTDPDGRQYACNETTGAYTFDVEQENRAMLVSYVWRQADVGANVPLTNSLQGEAPYFTAVFNEKFNGKALTLVLNRCATTALSLPYQQDDFMLQTLSFEALADANGVIGTLSIDDPATPQANASWPYHVQDYATFTSNASADKGYFQFPPPETFNSTAFIAGGELSSILRTYGNGVAETFNSSAFIAGGNIVTTVFRDYSNGVAETFNSTAFVAGGSLDRILRTYDQYVPETFNTSASIAGGTLS